MSRVFAFAVVSIGAALIATALDYGAGVTMAWYWWVVVGFGCGLIGAAWKDL